MYFNVISDVKRRLRWFIVFSDKFELAAHGIVVETSFSVVIMTSFEAGAVETSLVGSFTSFWTSV